MNNIGSMNLPEGTKARRVYLALRDQISAGHFGPGETLPTELRLAEEFEVSRVTVRRALDALSQGGLIERRAGSGTRVRPQASQQQAVSMNFSTLMPQLVEMVESTAARLLSFSYASAPDFVSTALGLDASTKVQIATRVRSTHDIPFSHLTTFVPAHIAQGYSENDLATTPLYKLLERSGVQIEEARQSVSATLAGPDVADALDVAMGTALLSVKRVVRDVEGNGVEFLSALYRPDMFRLEMPLARVGEGPTRHWEPKIGHSEEISI